MVLTAGPDRPYEQRKMARPSRTLAGTRAGTEFVATSEKAYPAVNAHGANDNATASAGLVFIPSEEKNCDFWCIPTRSCDCAQKQRPQHGAELRPSWSCLVEFGDWSPLEFDGFSDKRKLIAWDRPNDQLAPVAGAS